MIANCAYCGTEFSRRPYYIIKQGQRYCSRKCTSLANRGTSAQTFDRLVVKSSNPEDCWRWRGSQKRYPVTSRREGDRKIIESAHRIAYKLYIGPIPDGLQVLHRCDNQGCCNPAHLFLGTHADNMADKVAKGRQHKGEAHHRAKLTEADVLAIRRNPEVEARSAAVLYGVSTSLIQKIRQHLLWKDLP